MFYSYLFSCNHCRKRSKINVKKPSHLATINVFRIKGFCIKILKGHCNCENISFYSRSRYRKLVDVIQRDSITTTMLLDTFVSGYFILKYPNLNENTHLSFWLNDLFLKPCYYILKWCIILNFKRENSVYFITYYKR